MKNKLKALLIFSLVVNFILIAAGTYVIQRKGGVSWVSTRVKAVMNSDKKVITNYSPYYLTKKSIFEEQRSNENAIVFLGDSLTDNYDWAEKFNNNNIQNRGISSDTTDGVLNRLDNIINEKPKKIFIMIGINDLGNGKKISYIVNNYKTILTKIQNGSPNTTIYIQSVLPGNKSLNGSGISSNKDIMELNNELNKLSKGNIKFIDVFDSVKTINNDLNKNFTYDGTHLNGKGYELWTNIIKNYVVK